MEGLGRGGSPTIAGGGGPNTPDGCCAAGSPPVVSAPTSRAALLSRCIRSLAVVSLASISAFPWISATSVARLGLELHMDALVLYNYIIVAT